MRFVKGHNNRLKPGPDNPRWKGGRSSTGRGYVGLLDPAHPRVRSGHRYVAEHVLLAEQALGRALSAAHPVHHVDGRKTHNVRGNLVICEDAAYHNLLERRTRAYRACGDANARRCGYCKRYDRQADIVVEQGGRKTYHRACRNAHRRGETA